jgi:hypothetical protein
MKQYPRWTIILRRVLLALAGFATLVGAAYVEEDVRGVLAWKRFLRERAAEGRPIDFDFYLPARIPDAANLFKSDVLVQLFKYDSPETKKFQRDSGNIYDFWKTYGRWQRALTTDFRGAYAILDKKAPLAPYPGDKAAAALVLGQFAAIKPVLDEVCAAASARPRSQLGLRRNGAVEGNASGTLRSVSFGLCWSASAELELGENDEAFRDTYTGLRLLEGPLSVPTPLHLVIAMQNSVRSLQPFWEGCWRRAWNEGQLAEFQSLLSRMRPLRLLPAAIDMETAVSDTPSKSDLPRWMPVGWARLSLIAHADYESNGELRQFDPDSGQISLPAIRRSDDLLALQSRSLSPVTRIAASWVWRRVPTIARSQCEFVLSETACALERFRIATGKYPARLGELVPRFMAAVPRDVIDGAPLRYGPGADGSYILYSIGMNGVDDHGTLPTSVKFDYYPWQSTDGDWVWMRPKNA